MKSRKIMHWRGVDMRDHWVYVMESGAVEEEITQWRDPLHESYVLFMKRHLNV